LFLANENGEIVGRIMASDAPNYNASISNSAALMCSNSIDDVDFCAAAFVR